MFSLSFEFKHSYTPTAMGIEIPITLESGEGQVRILAKVDTGAEYCIFQREHGEALGLEIESGIPLSMTTASGRFQVYGHVVRMICFAGAMESTVYFAAELGFPRNVVGRVGWLDRFQMALVDHDGLLYLSPYA
jgi:hypothetical protein